VGPDLRGTPFKSTAGDSGRHHELRGEELLGDLDGAKILILWIEKLHLQEVRKFVDRREAVDLEWQSPC